MKQFRRNIKKIQQNKVKIAVAVILYNIATGVIIPQNRSADIISAIFILNIIGDYRHSRSLL